MGRSHRPGARVDRARHRRYGGAALPAITAAAEAGWLSTDQLVPLAELADPDSEARRAEDGPPMSPAALLALVRERRRVMREEAEHQHRRRGFRWWTDRHGAGVRFAGLLPDDAAAVVTEAIHRRAEEHPRNEQGLHDPYDVRCADALVDTCSGDLAGAGRPEVVVHVPVGGEGLAPTLVDGTPISIDVVRRLACERHRPPAGREPRRHGAGYGRRRRIVPDKLRARLRRRDEGCRWLGCGRTRGLRAHHLTHRAHDGPTDESNCVLLCSRHHQLVHEGGWDVRGDPAGTLEFLRPTCGTMLPVAPTPAPPELRRRYGLDAA